MIVNHTTSLARVVSYALEASFPEALVLETKTPTEARFTFIFTLYFESHKFCARESCLAYLLAK